MRSPPPPWATLAPDIPGWSLERLARVIVVLIGLGSIGRPLARNLRQLGVQEFVLSDPKAYGESSLGWQCAPSDLGRSKVDVVAEELRASGAVVTAFLEPIETVAPGHLLGETVLIETGDRRSATRTAHDLAFFLRRPVVSAHLEPSCLVSSCRVVDYRRDDIASCLLCSWGPDDYARLETIYSCSPSEGRSTRSPRALSEATAGWAALTTAGLFAADASQPAVDERQHLLGFLGPYHVGSTIDPNPDCACRVGRAPRPLTVTQSVHEVSLDDLAQRASFTRAEPSALSVTTSGRFVRRARCAVCATATPVLSWVSDLDRDAGRCDCGGDLLPIPFDTSTHLHRAELDTAWQQPLAELGFTPGASITLASTTRTASFVLIPAPSERAPRLHEGELA